MDVIQNCTSIHRKHLSPKQAPPTCGFTPNKCSWVVSVNKITTLLYERYRRQMPRSGAWKIRLCSDGCASKKDRPVRNKRCPLAACAHKSMVPCWCSCTTITPKLSMSKSEVLLRDCMTENSIICWPFYSWIIFFPMPEFISRKGKNNNFAFM